MSEEAYYCDKCKAFVQPELGKFQHPDLGERQGYLCPKCGSGVYLKEIKHYA